MTKPLPSSTIAPFPFPDPFFDDRLFLTGSNYCLQLKIRAEQLCLLHLVNAGSAIQKANLD
ncbi:hypothetical protein FYF90_10085 [Enterobacter sp. RVSM5a]|nr:hypothetical protein FYF90_10085 [Enterobacter sp. RVSM5a]